MMFELIDGKIKPCFCKRKSGEVGFTNGKPNGSEVKVIFLMPSGVEKSTKWVKISELGPATEEESREFLADIFNYLEREDLPRVVMGGKYKSASVLVKI